MSLDLKKLSIDPDGQKEDFDLLDPRTGDPLLDDEGNPVTLTLWGPDSTVVKTITSRHRKKFQNEAAKKGDMTSMFSLEYGMKLQHEKAVASVAGWKNIGYEGKELKCTEENVRMIFEQAPWIEEQVKMFIIDRANFMKG